MEVKKGKREKGIRIWENATVSGNTRPEKYAENDEETSEVT